MTEHRLICEIGGVRLDKFIADKDIGLSRSAAAGLIENGAAAVNAYLGDGHRSRLRERHRSAVRHSDARNDIRVDGPLALSEPLPRQILLHVEAFRRAKMLLEGDKLALVASAGAGVAVQRDRAHGHTIRRGGGDHVELPVGKFVTVRLRFAVHRHIASLHEI